MRYNNTELKYITERPAYLSHIHNLATTFGLPQGKGWGIAVQNYRAIASGADKGYQILITKDRADVTSTEIISEGNPYGWSTKRAIRKAVKRAIKIAG